MSRIPACLWLLLLPAIAGAQTRTPWTTSRVRGSPEPAKPYVSALVLPGLEFEQVLEMAALPDHLLLVEHRGKVWSAPIGLERLEKHLVLDLALRHPELGHLYGFTVHPRWRENRQVFVTYTVGNWLDDGSRLSRFRLASMDPPVIDPASEEVIFTWLSGGHNGANIQFGPDGFLYLTTGDGSGPTPPGSAEHGAGQQRRALRDPAARRRSTRVSDAALLGTAGQPLRRPTRGPSGNLGVRFPQSVENELRAGREAVVR